MRCTREHLIQIDYDGDQFSECVLCGGYGEIEKDIHEEGCPFVDPEVDRVWIEGKKRMADHTICGKCQEDTEKCPAAAHHGTGWALTEHATALKICKTYREKFDVLDQSKKD